MSDAPNLPTNVAAGASGHAQLHNDVNRAVNALYAPQDTGWRNITALMGSAPMVVLLRRVGDLVLFALNPTTQAYTTLSDLPVGFAPAFPTGEEGMRMVLPCSNDEGGFSGEALTVSGEGILGAAGITGGSYANGMWQWRTESEFPEDAPGVPYNG